MLARTLVALVVLAALSLGSAVVRADVAALRARLDALGAIADSEQDLARAAGAALDRADGDRARGDEAAAVRAERIAEATLALIERRRARTAAEASLGAAEAERDRARARASIRPAPPPRPRRESAHASIPSAVAVIRKGGLVVLLALAGCGAGARVSGALARDLGAIDLDRAAARAPDLVAAARASADEARAAESRGDEAAAEDDATMARLYAQAAVDEAARLEAEAARLEAEREMLAAEQETAEVEAARAGGEAALARLAAARTAREEAARALARAEVDEARPGRARQDSLTDVAEVREAARALRDRARLLDAAATALGAPPSPAVSDALTGSETATVPLEALARADAAHTAARARLAAARRAHPGVDAVRIASLVEAAESEGFHVVRLARGIGVEVEDVFEGATPRASRAGQARLARLAALLASYPEGPVRVEIDSTSASDAGRLARARAEIAVRALVAGGLDAARVVAADPVMPDATPSPGSRVRAVLVAYADTPPISGGSVAPVQTPDAAPATASGE